MDPEDTLSMVLTIIDALSMAEELRPQLAVTVLIKEDLIDKAKGGSDVVSEQAAMDAMVDVMGVMDVRNSVMILSDQPDAAMVGKRI